MSNGKFFYCFNQLDHVMQPDYSYWCWAACLSKMINGLNSDSHIGKDQCHLASYYASYLNQSERNLIYCCDDRNSSNCDQPLEKNHLVETFNLGGFSTKELEIDVLNNFFILVELIRSSKSPIVLNMQDNGQSHMVLLSGYGQMKECQYVLLSNPLYEAERYITFESFKNNYEINNVWSTSLVYDSIDTDKKIAERIMKIDHLLNRIPVNIKRNFPNYFFENKFYFTNNSRLQMLENYVNNKIPDLLVELKKDRSPDDDLTYCEPIVPRNWPINELNLNRFRYAVKEKTGSEIIAMSANEIIVKDYAIKIKWEEHDEEFYFNILSGPKDYTLNKAKSLSINELCTKLVTLPKLTYFKKSTNQNRIVKSNTILNSNKGKLNY